jgi:hypothetical protein
MNPEAVVLGYTSGHDFEGFSRDIESYLQVEKKTLLEKSQM